MTQFFSQISADSDFDLFSGQPGSEWHFKILRHFKLFDLLCSALHKKHSHKSQGETVNTGGLFVGFIGAKSSINQSNKPII